MREVLAQAGVLPTVEVRFIDLRLSHNGGPVKNLDDSRQRTSELLTALATDGSSISPPLLIAGATIVVPGGVMLPEALLVLDVLVVNGGARPHMLRVGEVKTYPDRGGYTDSTELATTRAQAGVYVHGLRLVLDELGLADRVQVSHLAF